MGDFVKEMQKSLDYIRMHGSRKNPRFSKREDSTEDQQ